MRVEFRDTDGHVLGTVTLENGVAVPNFDHEQQRRYLEEMTIIGPGAVTYTPADGEAYLRALPYNFRSPYLGAVLVEDD